METSKDDALSSVARLYDDGGPDEDDGVCEDRFAEGMARLFPDNSASAAGISGPELPRSSGATASSSQKNTASRTHQAQQDQQGRVVVSGSPSAQQLVTTQGLPTTNSVRTPAVSPQGSPPILPSSSSRHSSDKRKRSSMVVNTYFATVWAPKKDCETVMLKKQMCRRCMTVVQAKSYSLLTHTAKCRFMPLANKRNALEQSRDHRLPELNYDSREPSERKEKDKAKENDRGREARDAVLAKRPLSQTGLETDAKRRKGTASSSRRTGSKECTSKDCDRLGMSMLRAIVWHNLPLSICDRDKGYDTPFLEMLDEFKPDYPRCCKPNSEKFRNTYLPRHYHEMRQKVLRNLDLSLSGTYAHGTIMFDGWEDINGCSVVNVMLRVSSTFISGTATFFLDSIYTNEKKVDANKYVSIIEEVMKSFQGQRQSPFTGINGAVSDSARACVKAKNALTAKHAGLVGIQDQAHATDLLMADLGKLYWVDEVLSKVNVIVQAVRANRKLLSRYKQYVALYNEEIKRKRSIAGGQQSTKIAMEDVWSLLDTSDLEDLDEAFADATRVEQSPVYNPLMGQQRIAEPRSQPDAAPPPRTAVTLKKVAKTRFASSETMLEGYLRSRIVLQRLIRDSEFDRLYDGSRVANREKRDEQFVKVIEDDGFYRSVGDVHKILRVIRRYLRVWDAENSQISEVVPATILMDVTLRRLRETPFFTSQRKREVLDALHRRCAGKTTEDGGTMQIKILQDVHYSAWLLDPNLCPLNVAEYLPAFERHVMVYLAGAKEGVDIRGRKQLARAMTAKYKEVHKMWNILKKGTKNATTLETYAGYPGRYWEDETPAQTVSEADENGVAVDLQCFATNTLCLCPSSCATERSFSHQGRIHTKQRNRLKPEIVRMLLFSKWNGRALRNLDRITFDKIKDSESLRLGTLIPYEDFLSKPTASLLFSDKESSELLENICRKENRRREEIKNSRMMLYKHSDIYTFASARHDAAILRPQSGPSLSHSAQASTTMIGEGSARPASPTVLEGPRSYRANTREELTQLLSGSKERPARRSYREREGAVAESFQQRDDSHIQPVGGEQERFVGNRSEVRDEDNITMPASTARELMSKGGHDRSTNRTQELDTQGFQSLQAAGIYGPFPKNVYESASRQPIAPFSYPQRSAPLGTSDTRVTSAVVHTPGTRAQYVQDGGDLHAQSAPVGSMWQSTADAPYSQAEHLGMVVQTLPQQVPISGSMPIRSHQPVMLPQYKVHPSSPEGDLYLEDDTFD